MRCGALSDELPSLGDEYFYSALPQRPQDTDAIFDMLDEDRSDHIELHELKASRKMLQELAESASAQVMHSAQQCFFRGRS